MKKIMRCVAVLLCICTVLGTGAICHAETVAAEAEMATTGKIIVHKADENQISVSISGSEPGHKTSLVLNYCKKEKTTGKTTIESTGDSTFGNNISVFRSVMAGSGNCFLWVKVHLYVDNVLVDSVEQTFS